MENMSTLPSYVPRANQHPPFGTIKIEDGLIKDGLWDVYSQIPMGVCAEETAKKYDISRAQQDEFAIASLPPGAEGMEGREVPIGNCTRHYQGKEGRDRRVGRRRLPESERGEGAYPETSICQGRWDGHSRELVRHSMTELLLWSLEAVK